MLILDELSTFKDRGCRVLLSEMNVQTRDYERHNNRAAERQSHQQLTM